MKVPAFCGTVIMQGPLSDDKKRELRGLCDEMNGFSLEERKMSLRSGYRPEYYDFWAFRSRSMAKDEVVLNKLRGKNTTYTPDYLHSRGLGDSPLENAVLRYARRFGLKSMLLQSRR